MKQILMHQAFALGLLASFPAAASSLPPVSTLPPPQFDAFVLGGGFHVTTTDGTPATAAGGGNTLIATPDASVPKVSVYVDGAISGSLSAYASLVYSFQILGNGKSVDVGIGSNGGVSTSPGFSVGSVQLLLDGNQIANAAISTSQGVYIGDGPPCVFEGACTRTYSLDGTYDLTLDTVHTISMSASVEALAQNNVSQSMSAYIDPMITVPAGYTLLLSPGVGNSLTTVPEPGTWAMVILGFAALGLVARRSSVRVAS